MTEIDKKLIDAAPDLLAACHRLLNEVKWMQMHFDIITTESRANMAFARAAINKATDMDPDDHDSFDGWRAALKSARIDGWADYDRCLQAACIQAGIPDAQYESLCVELEAVKKSTGNQDERNG